MCFLLSWKSRHTVRLVGQYRTWTIWQYRSIWLVYELSSPLVRESANWLIIELPWNGKSSILVRPSNPYFNPKLTPVRGNRKGITKHLPFKLDPTVTLTDGSSSLRSFINVEWIYSLITDIFYTKRCLATVSNNSCLLSQMADRKCTHAHWRQCVKAEYSQLMKHLASLTVLIRFNDGFGSILLVWGHPVLLHFELMWVYVGDDDGAVNNFDTRNKD